MQVAQIRLHHPGFLDRELRELQSRLAIFCPFVRQVDLGERHHLAQPALRLSSARALNELLDLARAVARALLEDPVVIELCDRAQEQPVVELQHLVQCPTARYRHDLDVRRRYVRVRSAGARLYTLGNILLLLCCSCIWSTRRQGLIILINLAAPHTAPPTPARPTLRPPAITPAQMGRLRSIFGCMWP